MHNWNKILQKQPFYCSIRQLFTSNTACNIADTASRSPLPHQSPSAALSSISHVSSTANSSSRATASFSTSANQRFCTICT